jgi:hypothetical protein
MNDMNCNIECHTMEDVNHWNIIVGESNIRVVSTIILEKIEQLHFAKNIVRAAVPVSRMFN